MKSLKLLEIKIMVLGQYKLYDEEWKILLDGC